MSREGLGDDLGGAGMPAQRGVQLALDLAPLPGEADQVVGHARELELRLERIGLVALADRVLCLCDLEQLR